MVDERPVPGRMTPVTAEDRLAWELVRLSARWESTRRRFEAGQRLRLADGRLLWLLGDGRPRTLREIAVDLDLEQSTVNRQVNAALDAGLLERARPADGSAFLITASDHGRAVFDEDLRRHLDLQARALAAVPPAEREAFVERLADFVAALGEPE